MINKILGLSVVAVVSSFISFSPAQAAPVVRKVTGGYCLYKKAWKPAVKSGKTYSAMAKSAKKYAKLAKLCKDLLAPSKVSFSKIPNLKSLVTESASTASFANRTLSTRTVSGTPPTLSALATGDAGTVFFLPGVLSSITSGSPAESDCEQFFASAVDGRSGGMSSCYMAQTAGDTFGNVLQSGASSCYMQQIPIAAAANSSLASVVTGSLPSGGWNALFSTPASSSRLVKMSVTGAPGEGAETHAMDVFIRVSSDRENLSRAEQYRATLYFCEGGATAASESTIRISATNELTFTDKGAAREGGFYSSTVTAHLLSSGASLVFDPETARQAETTFVSTRGGGFKASISINAGIIRTKMLDIRDSTRKAYYITGYSGDSVPELRFLSGAFKEQFTFSGGTQNFSGGAEYRDTVYQSSPGSELVAALSESNLDTDPFYASSPTTPETPTFSCSSEPDIAITADMSSEGLRAIQNTCEAGRIEGGFCQSEALNAVQNAYFSYCMAH